MSSALQDISRISCSPLAACQIWGQLWYDIIPLRVHLTRDMQHRKPFDLYERLDLRSCKVGFQTQNKALVGSFSQFKMTPALDSSRHTPSALISYPKSGPSSDRPDASPRYTDAEMIATSKAEFEQSLSCLHSIRRHRIFNQSR